MRRSRSHTAGELLLAPHSLTFLVATALFVSAGRHRPQYQTGTFGVPGPLLALAFSRSAALILCAWISGPPLEMAIHWPATLSHL